MMGLARYKRFRSAALLGLFIISLSACAHAADPPVETGSDDGSPTSTEEADHVDSSADLETASPPVSEASSTPIDVQAPMATVSEAEVMQGGLTRIIVTISPDATKVPKSATFEGEQIPLYPQGDGKLEGVVAVPHDRKIGPASITVGSEKVPINVVDGKFGSESIKVDAKHVNPPKKLMKRILAEQREIGKIYREITQKKYWHGPFRLPIHSTVTSPYGQRRMYNGEQRNFHPGMDLRAKMNTPIHAAAAGKVVLAKNLYFTGNTVGVDHGYGVITLYCHMNKIKVKIGEEVRAGQLLGLSGKTGRVSGPHLHWQAVVHKVKVNPLELTKRMR